MPIKNRRLLKLLRKLVQQRKEREICLTCILKCNSNREKNIFLIIFNKKDWQYLAVKKYNGKFYCLNCLHYFRKENKLKCHEKGCKNKYFCRIALYS